MKLDDFIIVKVHILCKHFNENTLYFHFFVCIQCSHVLCAVQAGLAGPGSDGDVSVIIIIFTLRVKGPAVKVR